MKDFKKFREQLNEYGLTPAMLKKSNPLRGKGYPHNESQRFGGKTNIPASPETKKYIESGKGIILDVPSSLHPTSRFAIYKNPAKGSRQDKVLMATISNPKRGRVKMFSFHGSHVSHQKAMDFAKKHKLVAMKDKDGNPLYAKESVELDEAHLKKGDKVKWKGKVGTVVRYDKGGPQSPFYVVSFKGQYKSENIPAHKLKESVELDEAIKRTFKFATDKQAKQFEYDISNAGVAVADRVGNKVTVNTGLERKTAQTIAKYMKKNKGKLVKESVELDEGKTEFAVVAKASGMLIKAFPKEEHARMYIKNKYSQRKNLKGNLGIIEVPKSRAPGNNMKKYGNIEVVKESVEQLDETSAKEIESKGDKLFSDKNRRSFWYYKGYTWMIDFRGAHKLWPGSAPVKESVALDEYRRQDVYVIVDKKGKVVAAKLTKKNAHKEISRHRDGTIVLDPDAKTGDVLKTFAKESVELDERTSGPTRMAIDKEFTKMTRSGRMDTMAAIKHVEKMFKVKNVKVAKDKRGKPYVISFNESVELDEVKISRNPQLRIGLGKGRPAGQLSWQQKQLRIINFINAVEKNKKSWKSKVTPQGMRAERGDWTIVVGDPERGHPDKVTYNNKNMPWKPKSGKLPFDKFMKLLDVWKKEYNRMKESVELDEDNTAAVAKQVKQAVKKHTTGKLVVRSKGGKSRFIMVRADSIDNKLRKMMLDVVAPKANVRDKSNISYGNISSNMISASVDHWVKALGLKEIYTRPSYGKPEEGSTRGVYSSKTFSKMKEQIANVAGSGAVAGLGDEPPVSKAAQKKKQMGATGDIARRKSIPAPKKGDLMPPALGESVETFAGCRVFEVEDEEYGKALYGRKKWERWSKKLDMNKETNQVIRTYASRNPGKPVVLKNKKTGDMSYLINKNY